MVRLTFQITYGMRLGNFAKGETTQNYRSTDHTIQKSTMVLFMFLEPDANGRCYHLNMALALHVTDDSRNGLNWMFSKRHGLNC